LRDHDFPYDLVTRGPGEPIVGRQVAAAERDRPTVRVVAHRQARRATRRVGPQAAIGCAAAVTTTAEHVVMHLVGHAVARARSDLIAGYDEPGDLGADGRLQRGGTMCVLLRAQGRAAAVVGQTWPRAMLPTDFSHAPPMRGAMGALGLAVLRLGAILVVEDDEGCAVGDYFRVSAPAWAPLDTVDTWPTSRAMLWPRVKLRVARGAQEKPRKRPQQPHMVMYQCGCCVGYNNRCWDARPRAAAAARAARGCYRAQRMDYAKRAARAGREMRWMYWPAGANTAPAGLYGIRARIGGGGDWRAVLTLGHAVAQFMWRGCDVIDFRP